MSENTGGIRIGLDCFTCGRGVRFEGFHLADCVEWGFEIRFPYECRVCGETGRFELSSDDGGIERQVKIHGDSEAAAKQDAEDAERAERRKNPAPLYVPEPQPKGAYEKLVDKLAEFAENPDIESVDWQETEDRVYHIKRKGGAKRYRFRVFDRAMDGEHVCASAHVGDFDSPEQAADAVFGR